MEESVFELLAGFFYALTDGFGVGVTVVFEAFLKFDFQFGLAGKTFAVKSSPNTIVFLQSQILNRNQLAFSRKTGYIMPAVCPVYA